MNDAWDGRTYYGRPSVKPAPFDKWLVGGYVFLAGLSGSSQLLSTLLDLTRGAAAGAVVRRGRLISLLAPTIGSVLLIADLHTPARFYNMLRVFKITSPMSIGTWMLSVFSGFSVVTWLADRMRGVARVAQVPAAITGAGMGTYTASLLSATSTPLWAAAPGCLAVRFAASSVASGAAVLSVCTRQRDIRRDLDIVCATALAVELAATVAARADYRRTGVVRALEGIDGRMESVGGTLVGAIVPLALFGAEILTGNRSRRVSGIASMAVLAGSLAMRVGVIGAGQNSARRPDVSLGFTQPRPR